MKLRNRVLTTRQVLMITGSLLGTVVALVAYLAHRDGLAKHEQMMRQLERQQLEVLKRVNQAPPSPTLGPGDYPMPREKTPLYPGQLRSRIR